MIEAIIFVKRFTRRIIILPKRNPVGFLFGNCNVFRPGEQALAGCGDQAWQCRFCRAKFYIFSGKTAENLS